MTERVGFSLEAPDGVRFLTPSRVFSEPELASVRGASHIPQPECWMVVPSVPLRSFVRFHGSIVENCFTWLRDLCASAF
jgi:hypothetical protein